MLLTNDLLQALEKLLSVTEKYKSNFFSSEDKKVWGEISAKTADYREELDHQDDFWRREK